LEYRTGKGKSPDLATKKPPVANNATEAVSSFSFDYYCANLLLLVFVVVFFKLLGFFVVFEAVENDSNNNHNAQTNRDEHVRIHGSSFPSCVLIMLNIFFRILTHVADRIHEVYDSSYASLYRMGMRKNIPLLRNTIFAPPLGQSMISFVGALLFAGISV
jgi:hypothetical protein